MLSLMKRAQKDLEWKKEHGETYTAYKKRMADEKARRTRNSLSMGSNEGKRGPSS